MGDYRGISDKDTINYGLDRSNLEQTGRFRWMDIGSSMFGQIFNQSMLKKKIQDRSNEFAPPDTPAIDYYLLSHDAFEPTM